MNLNQINAFLTIVETNNFTKAADKLYISQSTLSDRLSALEEDLDTRLIKRRSGKKKLELTEKGIEFLDYAARYIELENEVNEWKQAPLLPHLKIGAPQSVNTYLFRGLYRSYLAESYQIHVSSHWNRTIYSMVNSFDIDIGIVSKPYQSNQVTTKELINEPLLIIYDNRFSNYHQLDELKRSDQIYIGWGPDYKDWYYRQWDSSVPARITLDSPELLMDYLESEDTWAIVPLCVYQDIIQKNDHIKTVPTESDIHRTLYLIYKMGQGEARNQKIKEFIESLHDYILDLESKELCTVLGDKLYEK
jgi:DNA-binding transcriptional LysR family regulator